MFKDIISELHFENDVVLLSPESQFEISNMVNKWAFGENNGQCRGDVQHRIFNMVGVELGSKGDCLSKSEKYEYKAKVVNEIYINEEKKNTAYTIFDGLYPKFLLDVFNESNEVCWFLPSMSLGRSIVYEGAFDKIIKLIDTAWRRAYEFSICSKDLKWFVDYNHHHSILIIGDDVVKRAQFVSKRRKWNDKIKDLKLYPKSL